MFDGTAEVTRTAFEERCTVYHSHGTFDANRTYILHPAGGGVQVRFPDGRAFVGMDERARQHVRHLCGNDLYRGRFLFGEGEWREAWTVRGPRKDYISLTRYRPAG